MALIEAVVGPIPGPPVDTAALPTAIAPTGTAAGPITIPPTETVAKPTAPTEVATPIDNNQWMHIIDPTTKQLTKDEWYFRQKTHSEIWNGFDVEL